MPIQKYQQPAHRLSYLGVPVATGMSDCYENRLPPLISSFQRSKACPVPRYGAGIQNGWGGVRPPDDGKNPTRRPAIFILLCGLRKPMVIPAYKGARYDALIPDTLDLPFHWRASSRAMRQLIEDCR